MSLQKKVKPTVTLQIKYINDVFSTTLWNFFLNRITFNYYKSFFFFRAKSLETGVRICPIPGLCFKNFNLKQKKTFSQLSSRK